MGTQQVNFRLSAEATALLESAADKQKSNKTDVVEYCVARYAADLGIDVEKASAVILRQIAANIAASSRRISPPTRETAAESKDGRKADLTTGRAIPLSRKSRQGKVP